jgi:hypothetical protein
VVGDVWPTPPICLGCRIASCGAISESIARVGAQPRPADLISGSTSDSDDSGATESEETQRGGPFHRGGSGVHPGFHVGVAQMGFYGVEGQVQFGCHVGVGQPSG